MDDPQQQQTLPPGGGGPPPPPVVYVNHAQVQPIEREVILMLGTNLPGGGTWREESVPSVKTPLFRCVMTQRAARALMDALAIALSATPPFEPGRDRVPPWE